MPAAAYLSLLVLAWVTYCGLHSALASLAMKAWLTRHWPALSRHYRVLYNLLAIVLLVPPLWLMVSWPESPLWQWWGPWGWLADGLALAAVAGFVISLRYYDLQSFWGLRQWRSGQDKEVFTLSPLHRFVRHPWYSFALVIIWTRDMDAARLVSALVISAYLVIGARLEEHKLLTTFGDVYSRYRERVPGLIPRPWRYLDTASAQRLIANQRHRTADP